MSIPTLVRKKHCEIIHARYEIFLDLEDYLGILGQATMEQDVLYYI